MFPTNRYVSHTISAGLTIYNAFGVQASRWKNCIQHWSDNFSTSLAGNPSKEFSREFFVHFFCILFLILIYLVLAAQFESFRDPLIIMLTVPLAILLVVSLSVCGETLNIFSQNWNHLLIGLVTKWNFLIEFANQRKADGLNRLEAIVDASTSGVCPILMTTNPLNCFGNTSIALAFTGSESRVSMGCSYRRTIILNLLTLYVIPAIYSYIFV